MVNARFLVVHSVFCTAAEAYIQKFTQNGGYSGPN